MNQLYLKNELMYEADFSAYINEYIYLIRFIHMGVFRFNWHAKKLVPICQVRIETELSYDVDFMYGLHVEAAN